MLNDNPTPDPWPAQDKPASFAGRFTLGELLGEGGFGQVHLAYDTLSGQETALKRVMVRSEGHAERLQREILALKLLDDPGVVGLIAHGREGDTIWLAMERVRGRPFGRGLSGDGAARWEALREPLRRLLETLARVHERGIVHRDLKPANVLLRDDGQPIVLDLGLVRGDDLGPSLTRTLGVVGTPPYLSPEQARGGRVDGQTDIYALGVMLYEALTDRPPYRARDLVSLEWERERHEPTPVERLAGGLPSEAASLVTRMLQRDAEARPGAMDCLSALEGHRRADDFRLPWLGDETVLHGLACQARRGKAADLWGPPCSGKTRALEELATRLGAVSWLVPAERPYASLIRVLGVTPTGGTPADVEEQVRRALDRADVTLLADDWTELDPWTRALLEDWSPQGGVVRVREAPSATRLRALAEETLRGLFVGPERVLHIPSDAARQLIRRTGGLSGRVFDQLRRWAFMGWIRREGDRFHIERDSLDRLAVESAAPPLHRLAHDLSAEASELLQWVRLLGPMANLDLLARFSDRPGWEVQLQLRALEASGAVLLHQERWVALAEGRRGWSEERLQDAHAQIAAVLNEGEDGRFEHLLRAGRREALGQEAAALVRRKEAQGRLGEATALLWLVRDLEPSTPALTGLLVRLLLSKRSQEDLAQAQDAAARSPEAHRLVRAARFANASQWEAVEQTIGGTSTWADPDLAWYGHVLRVRAARERSEDAQAALIGALQADPRVAHEPAYRAHWLSWLGLLRFRQRRYAEAAALAEEAAPRRNTLAGKVSTLLNAARARIMLYQPERAQSLARRALADAQEARLCSDEANALRLLRAADNQLGATEPDLDLVDEIAALREPRLEAEACLTEGLIAWRGRHGSAAGLARRAARGFQSLGWTPSARYAFALAWACDGEGDIQGLLQGLYSLSDPALRLDGLALVAQAGAEVVMSDELIQTTLVSLQAPRRPLRVGAMSESDALYHLKLERPPMRAPTIFTSILHTAARRGAFDLSAAPAPRLIAVRDTFTPSTDAGTAEYKVGGDLAGLGHVDEQAPHTLHERLLLRDTAGSGYGSYPPQSPRLPGASPADVAVSERSAQYSDGDDFIDNVRSDLGLGSTDSATYARAVVRRFEVVDVTDLKNDLTETTPKSLAITRLVGTDSGENTVYGWVYTEKETVQGNKAIKQIHQFVPPTMLLPPNATMTLEDFDNTGDWDLMDLIEEKVQEGWQYSRCLCWYEAVDSQQELEAAGMPAAPATPDGVVNWS